jgi:hypothetical protein
MSSIDKLYVNESRVEAPDEYSKDTGCLCLSPYEDDPADAVCWGETWYDESTPEQEELFKYLALAWNNKDLIKTALENLAQCGHPGIVKKAETLLEAFDE